MTQFKYLVLALATTAGAVAPPTLRGVMDDASGAVTVGDTFEMSLARNSERRQQLFRSPSNATTKR